MKRIAFATLATLLSVMLIAAMPLPTFAPSPRHCKGLDIYFYETPEQAHFDLTAGKLDFYQWSLTFEQYEDAVSDPKIQLAAYAENGMMEFDLNHNYTVAAYPGVRNPMTDLNFRKAIACMVDKDFIITNILSGQAQRIDAPVCAPQTGYVNASITTKGGEPIPDPTPYPYPFDLVQAANYLTAGGFIDTDLDGIRNYPTGWPGRATGPNLDGILAKLRSDHLPRLEAGRRLCDNMVALGVPVAKQEATSDILRPIVMAQFNYHIYTGGWSLGRYPTYMYSLFHYDNWFPNGPNYLTGIDNLGNPSYPAYDAILQGIYYAPSIPAFKASVDEATYFHVMNVINIPLWSYTAFWGYRKNLVGIVNMDGYGLENTYTFLNAYKVDDKDTPENEAQMPLKMGTVHSPKALNPLYSTWYYDYAVLDRVFSGGMATEPYNLATDNPWVFQDWAITEWYDFQDDEMATKVTYYIRKDVYWHAPETGAEVRQFNAHDLEFSIWYNYAFDDSWQWSGFKDVKYTHVVNDFTLEVYFDTASIWLVYAPTYPLLPKYEYIGAGLCRQSLPVILPIPDPIDPSTKMILPTEDTIVQMISAISNLEGPLVQGVDYEIFATGTPDWGHNEVHWLRPMPGGDVVTFVFWTTDPPIASGVYLGGLPWQQTWYSIGPYYPILLSPGVGGKAQFNCNPSHFLGAPPLGEIDWMWTWVGTTKPRSGYFQVFLFDAVRLLGSYCARGDGVFDTAWFPGADIDPTDLCHVGLYDAVTVLGKYGQKFGIPPDP